MLWLLLESLPAALPALGGVYLAWARPTFARRKHAACLRAISRLERELGVGEFDRVWANDKTDVHVVPANTVLIAKDPYGIEFRHRPVAALAMSATYVPSHFAQYGLQQSAAHAAYKAQLEAALLFGSRPSEPQTDSPRIAAPMFAATGAPIIH